jgi:ABC-type uncharacterized transport system involved in gliding motility auxiliary subunit
MKKSDTAAETHGGDARRRERILFWLGLSALILAAFAGSRWYFKLDLSRDRASTLSAPARELYRRLPEGLRITYYVSRQLKDRHPGPAAVEDLLRELESRSRGLIRVRVVDPAKDPSEAERFGVAPQQLQVVERSEQRVAIVYSGIVLEYLGEYETIPALIDTATLEYDIVRLARALAGAKRPVAAMLVGDADKTLDNDYASLKAALERAGYLLRPQERGRPVEADADLLFVLGNASLDRYDAYFVDEFLMRGGAAFMALKGVNVNPDYGLLAEALPPGGFLAALSAYGVDLRRELVLDQLNLTVPFQTQGPSGALSLRYVRYPHWIAVDARNVELAHPIGAAFAGLDLFWPSPMELRAPAGVSATALARTSPRAWRQTRDFAAAPEDEYRYEDERAATGGQFIVAAALSGPLPSAFASGDLPSRDGEPALSPPIRNAAADARLVVVSSADFLTELLRMSGSGFNLSFALAAADWLSADADLAAVRTRGQADLRLNKIQDEGLREFVVGLSYALNLIAIPALVAALGLLRAAARRRREAGARAEGGA